MLIKNGTRYYDDKELREYGRGYWDGRFNGWRDITANVAVPYLIGFEHGEADYLEYDADFEPDPVFDDLDVVEQIKNHPQEPTQTC